MNRSYRILPIYTADVSGVCSALFELGGMVVMHDPSGCNSTYNTHDELRWYDQDSLIFISGLFELDAIMGNDQKFIHDIVSTAEALKPRFIALASAPIPYLNGTDFDGISLEIQNLTQIPTFFVPTNGMHDYTIGAGNALAEIVKRFVHQSVQKRSHSVNLLGVTPLDFGSQEMVEALKTTLTGAGWKVLSCWAMGDDLDTIRRSGEASVNLVVSAVGLRAAKLLQQKFGTPYVIGAPIGLLTKDVFQALERAEKTGVSQSAFDVPFDQEKASLTLIGEPVLMKSLMAHIYKKHHMIARYICPLEGCEEVLEQGDLLARGEEELEAALKDAELVIADPLYRPICPKNAAFFELPHVAFSGRCFQKGFINLFEPNFLIERCFL